MEPFRYLRPTNLTEVVDLLVEHGDSARVLAGGTDLMIGLRHGAARPETVIDVKGLAEAASIVEDEGTVRIGACVPLTDVIGDPRVASSFPGLVEAAVTVGSLAIRNRATLGGNVCNASPAADTVPALLVYGAEVEIVGPGGSRRVPLDGFITGPGRTGLEPGEIVVSLRLPVPEKPGGVAFSRMTRRRGVDLATVNLCCRVDRDGVTTFAFGAVGPRAFLARDESGVLADPAAPAESRRQVLAALTGQATPISDVRGSAEYRTAMVDVMSRRALAAAIERLDAA